MIFYIVAAIHFGLTFLCFIHVNEDFVSSKKRKTLALIIAVLLPIFGSMIAYKMMSEYSKYNLSLADSNSGSSDNYTPSDPGD